MTAWSESTVQANDITIHYYRAGGDKKPPILLLHGIADSGRCWSRVSADLAGSYDVAMTDARGHGHSGTSADFSIALLADDAAAVIRAVGLAKPYVWGHSMGAITAATLAAAYPDLVRAIVLEDPPLRDEPLFQETPDKALLQAGGEQQEEQYGWQWLFELRTLPREERIARGFALNPDWAKEEIIPWADSKAELNIVILEPALSAVAHATPWREVIARIECPILLITGEPQLHAVVTAEIAQQAAQLWKHGEVLHIRGAGHNIHRDRYDETMVSVRDFLSRT